MSLVPYVDSDDESNEEFSADLTSSTSSSNAVNFSASSQGNNQPAQGYSCKIERKNCDHIKNFENFLFDNELTANEQCDSSKQPVYSLPDSEFWTLSNETCSDIETVINSERFHLRSRAPSFQTPSSSSSLFPLSSTKDKKQLSVSNDTRKANLYKSHPFVLTALHQRNRHGSAPPTKCSAEMSGHSSAVSRVRWCKEENSHLLASASMDASIKVWNIFSSNISEVCSLQHHTKGVRDIQWNASGKQLLSCGYDKTVRISDVQTGVELYCCNHSSYVTCIKYHPVNYNLFISGHMDEVQCWDDRVNSQPIRSFKYRSKLGQVNDLCFTRDGNMFFTCNDVVNADSADRTIMAWDFNSTAVLSNQIYQERYSCTRLVNNPVRPEILAQSNGNYIALISTISPFKINKFKRFAGHKVSGYDIGCDISPSGRLVLSGSADGQLLIYDYQTADVIRRHSISDDIALDVCWHPVLRSTVACSTWTGKVCVFQ